MGVRGDLHPKIYSRFGNVFLGAGLLCLLVGISQPSEPWLVGFLLILVGGFFGMHAKVLRRLAKLEEQLGLLTDRSGGDPEKDSSN